MTTQMNWRTACPTQANFPIPIQIHQLAAILYNTLTHDCEFNAAILEKLECQADDPAESNLKLFNAAELAHLGKVVFPSPRTS